jgi:hypothetical protein
MVRDSLPAGMGWFGALPRILMLPCRNATSVCCKQLKLMTLKAASTAWQMRWQQVLRSTCPNRSFLTMCHRQLVNSCSPASASPSPAMQPTASSIQPIWKH